MNKYSYEGSTVLVTGYGFVSPYVTDRLVNAGAEVTVVEKDPLALAIGRNKIRNFNSVEYINGNIGELFNRDFDYVFHLAGITNVRYAENNPLETYEENVITTLKLLKHIEINKRLLFTSSAVVYGNSGSKSVISEDTPLMAQSIYGDTKVAAETLIHSMAQRLGFKYTVARFFNLYGPGQSHIYLIPQLIKQALTEGQITVWNTKTVRDFLFVGDAVDCITSAVLNSSLENTSLNVGSGFGRTVKEVADEVAALIKGNIEVKSLEKYDPASPMVLISDITKARSIGWSPSKNFSEGLKETISYMSGEVALSIPA